MGQRGLAGKKLRKGKVVWRGVDGGPDGIPRTGRRNRRYFRKGKYRVLPRGPFRDRRRLRAGLPVVPRPLFPFKGSSRPRRDSAMQSEKGGNPSVGSFSICGSDCGCLCSGDGGATLACILMEQTGLSASQAFSANTELKIGFSAHSPARIEGRPGTSTTFGGCRNPGSSA